MSKILFVIGLSKSGGAEKRAILISSLLKEFNDTKVFAFSGESSDVDFSFKKTYGEYKKTSIKKRIDGLRFVFDYYNPDFVVSFMPHVNLLTTLALAKKKYKNVRHVVAITFPKFKFKNELFLKYSVGKCDAVYFQTQNQKRFLKTKKPNFVLPNPINCPKVIPIHNDSLSFMSVGRLTEQKNFLFLLKSFSIILKIYPEATLDIYGSGPQKKMLENYIETNNLSNNVFMVEYDSNISDHYLGHNIFLYSSLSEGFPNALAEAMSYGLTCFTTYFETGCTDLIINKKTGYVCYDRSVESYSKMVIDALKDTDEMKNISTSGYEHVSTLCNSKNFAMRFNQELIKLKGK